MEAEKREVKQPDPKPKGGGGMRKNVFDYLRGQQDKSFAATAG